MYRYFYGNITLSLLTFIDTNPMLDQFRLTNFFIIKLQGFTKHVKPIFYFITDLNEYANNRGFYDDIVHISNNKVNTDWDQLLVNLKNNTKQTKYINHQHFDYLMENPPNNVRKNIIEMVNNEIKNG